MLDIFLWTQVSSSATTLFLAKKDWGVRGLTKGEKSKTCWRNCTCGLSILTERRGRRSGSDCTCWREESLTLKLLGRRRNFSRGCLQLRNGRRVENVNWTRMPNQSIWNPREQVHDLWKNESTPSSKS